MSREAWNTLKRSKSFYVRTYRMAETFLLISLFLNLMFGMGIHYRYFHHPERAYYATSGITPPVRLHPLLTANHTSSALLDPDPINEDDVKVIPQ